MPVITAIILQTVYRTITRLILWTTRTPIQQITMTLPVCKATPAPGSVIHRPGANRISGSLQQGAVCPPLLHPFKVRSAGTAKRMNQKGSFCRNMLQIRYPSLLTAACNGICFDALLIKLKLFPYGKGLKKNEPGEKIIFAKSSKALSREKAGTRYGYPWSSRTKISSRADASATRSLFKIQRIWFFLKT